MRNFYEKWDEDYQKKKNGGRHHKLFYLQEYAVEISIFFNIIENVIDHN